MANNEVKTQKKKGRLGAFLSKSASELKKVSWPTFSTVMQNLGVVLVVVVAFAVIITATDTGLSALLKLLVG